MLDIPASEDSTKKQRRTEARVPAQRERIAAHEATLGGVHVARPVEILPERMVPLGEVAPGREQLLDLRRLRVVLAAGEEIRVSIRALDADGGRAIWSEEARGARGVIAVALHDRPTLVRERNDRA